MRLTRAVGCAGVVVLSVVGVATAGTGSWSDPKRLGWKDKKQAYGVEVASDGQHVVAGWLDTRRSIEFGEETYDIFIRESADGGRTWEQRELVSPQDDGVANRPPGIGIAAGQPVVVWDHRFDSKPSALVFARRTIEGWSYQEFPGTSDAPPVITTSAEDVWVGVVSGSSVRLFRSALDETSWEEAGALSMSELGLDWRMDLAAGTNGLHLAWLGSSDRGDDIMTAVAAFEDLSWVVAPSPLVETSKNELAVNVERDGTSAVVIWTKPVKKTGSRLVSRLFAARSDDEGQTWSAPDLVSRLKPDYLNGSEVRPGLLVAGPTIGIIATSGNKTTAKGLSAIAYFRGRIAADWTRMLVINNRRNVVWLDGSGNPSTRADVVFSHDGKGPMDVFYLRGR